MIEEERDDLAEGQGLNTSGKRNSETFYVRESNTQTMHLRRVYRGTILMCELRDTFVEVSDIPIDQ